MPKIAHVKVWSADLGNIKPYTISFKTVDEVKNVFVQVTLDNGITGIGAGNPSEFVVGENVEQALRILSEENISFLIGREISEINQLLFELLQKFPSNPGARAAVDIALHDTFTKFLGVPLVKYLGEKIKKLPTSNTIGIKSVEDTLKEGEDYIKRGFKIFKVKLGKTLEEDIERIVKLREKFGYGITIRIDANQGWSFDETIDFYIRTKDLQIELIEQPLPAKAVMEMKRLPEEIKNLIAADESLISPQDAFHLVSYPKACKIFNIKLMKCGGVSEARKIADIASVSAVDLFWGCNDESIISITAALHVAFSCPNTKYIDLDGSLDLAKDIVEGGFILKDGFMYCSDEPGLGVRIK